MGTDQYIVSEIFGPTIQGEGPHIGAPCFFIRFGGCDYRCIWCDSLHAVLPSELENLNYYSVEEIMAEVIALWSTCPSVTSVVLSGGNPLIWDLSPLVSELHSNGFAVWVETQGSIYRDWVSECDAVIISPKPPSAQTKVIKGNKVSSFINKCLGNTDVYLKFVLMDIDKDLPWISQMVEDITLDTYETPKIFFSLGTETFDTTETLLVRYKRFWEVLKKRSLSYDYQFLPQFHVLLWGHQKGV